LWTRSISTASFDLEAPVGVGVDGGGLDDPAGSGAAPLAAEAGVAVAGGLDAFVPADPVGGCGLAIYPASATPIASPPTSANGASVMRVPRFIGRIFIEAIRSSASNHAQRRTQTKALFDD
jgi:hypothetical protein